MSVPDWRVHIPDGVDPETVDLGRGGTLPVLWARRWAAAPYAPVIHDRRGWTTGAEVEALVAGATSRLLGRGLVAGDRVIVSAASTLDLVVAHIACLRAGAVVVPTNAAYGRGELEHIVLDAKPTFAIVDDDQRAAHIAAADRAVIITSPSIDFEPSDLAPPTLRAGDPALIGYTSGTTGRPKGAVLSHANLLASVNALLLSWRWTASDRLVLCLPLFHMHGLGVGLHGTLAAGASAVLLQGFEPNAVFEAITEHNATLFFGVPTMYHRLAQSARADELTTLRLMVSGSAPMPAALHERMFQLTGSKVLERYGMTETAMLVSNPYDAERRGGSVGIPLPGVEVRLVGEPPEVQVRGPNVFRGYWNRDDANADAFEEGWFRTGDLGSLDADGYLTLDGRSKELIISGGFNVYPREVEDAIRTHDRVDDVAVAGTPSDEWGEEVTAYVVGGPVTVEELKAHVGKALAPYKRPRRVHLVDELPRNALGKVQKHRLSEGEVLP
jgi:malonyl-CoA/methylmalonyl-CoA synthetase